MRLTSSSMSKYKGIVGEALCVYFLRVGIAFDQLVNAILGGYPNETLSARSWRKGKDGDHSIWSPAYQLIDVLFCFQPDHCREAHEYSKVPWKTCGIYMPIACEHCPSLNKG